MPLAFYVYTTANGTLTGVPTQVGTTVQSVSINAGRDWLTDPYSPATCTVVMRGIASVQIGNPIIVLSEALTTTKTYSCAFVGTVKDTAVRYGIVSNLDYTTIIVESYLARWGRRQFVSRALTQAITTTQLNTLATAIGFNSFTTATGGASTAAGQTYVGNGLDLVNALVQTEVGHLRDGKGYASYNSSGSGSVTISPDLTFLGRSNSVPDLFTFADDSTADGIRFQDIDFGSAAQNYYTEATINPLGLATQTAGSGNYNITQDSLDFSTGQALSHAQYLVSQFKTTTATPLRLTASYSNQNTTTRQTEFQKVVTGYGSGTYGLINSGSVGTLIFRGTTYFVVVEGFQVSADVSDTILELTLSAFDNNNYLILNDAVFGTLGTSGTYPGNKLGF